MQNTFFKPWIILSMIPNSSTDSRSTKTHWRDPVKILGDEELFPHSLVTFWTKSDCCFTINVVPNRCIHHQTLCTHAWSIPRNINSANTAFPIFHSLVRRMVHCTSTATQIRTHNYKANSSRRIIWKRAFLYPNTKHQNSLYFVLVKAFDCSFRQNPFKITQ